MTEQDPQTRQIAKAFQGTLGEHLGIRFIAAGPDAVRAELDVAPHLMTTNGRVHGGTLMALADTVGAVGAFLTLAEGAQGTTTLESKTNFFAAATEGTLQAEATPIHVGRRTSVWQTRVTDGKGRLVSLTTQTQMAL
ncbi:PaaI family thioesterase [Zavarzinia sp. CC-PAN008]|uniref:PaaI family thioesterase n=1 Tax=Zavarzinia sp. CC-PAN008 TaxID=3243332 RepID=UPI003F744BF0